jgi:prepilin peptidase CpaA
MSWTSIVIAFVIAAAYADVRTRRIPRQLTIAGLLAGLLFHAIAGGFLGSLAAAGVAFAVAMAMFSIGAIGGGDVKLIAALGAMLGLDLWGHAMGTTIVVAALMAVFEVVRHRRVRQTLRNMLEICRTLWGTNFHGHPVLNVQNSAALRSPFGVAAAIGTIVALIH